MAGQNSEIRNPKSEIEVTRIADLARIQLSPEEEARAREELGAIVGYVGQLSELDTSGVEPLHHVLDIRNVLREDEPQPSLPTEEVLANAPARKGDFFVVPKVIRESDEVTE